MIRIDKTQMTRCLVDGEDVVVVPVLMPVSDIAAELRAYRPSASSHPLAAQAKPIARPILDAVREFVEK